MRGLLERLTRTHARGVLVLGALFAVAVMAGAALHVLHEWHEMESRGRDHAELMGRLLEEHATRAFQSVDLSLAVTAEALRSDAEQFRASGDLGRELARPLRRSPVLRSVSLLDEAGQVIASSNPRNVGAALTIGGDSWLPSPVNVDASMIGRPQRGRDLHDLTPGALAASDASVSSRIIPFVRRISLPRLDTLYLVAVVNPDYFANYYRLALEAPEDHAAVIGFDGVVIASSGFAGGLPGETVAKSTAHTTIFQRFMPKLEFGAWTAPGLSSADTLSAFRASRTYPFVALVEVSRARLWARWLESARLVLLIALGCATVVALSTWLARRSVVSRERARDALRVADAERRRSDNRAQHVLDSALDAIVSVDREGRVIDFNPAAERLFGWTRAEASGRDHTDLLVQPWRRDGHRKAFRALVAGDKRLDLIGRRVVVSLQAKDGHEIPIEASVTMAELADGEVVYTSHMRDISERVDGERRLRDQLAFTEGLIELVQVPIYVKSPEGRYTMVNRALEALYDRPRDEIVGRHPADLFPEEEVREIAVRDAELLAAGGTQTFEMQVTRAGAQRHLLFRKTCFHRADGSLAGIIGTIIDTSDMRTAERHIREAKDAAEAASRAKSEFLANMSHEIRTPMNGVLGMTRLALDTELTGEQRDYLQNAYSSAEALLAIIDDVLDFSRIEAGKMKIERIAFDPREVVRAVARMLAVQAHGKGLELVVRVEAGVPTQMEGDPTRLRQILVNLVGNAVKFTDAGEVEMTVGVVDSGGASNLVVSVRDTGPGLSAEQRARLFQAFQQADSSITRRFGGTGLGLAISSRLAQLMSGALDVDSEPGVGSTFQLTLPIQAGRVEREAIPHVDLRDDTVLVVDGNRAAREALERLLTSFGARVECVATLDHAERKLLRRETMTEGFDWVIASASLATGGQEAIARAIREMAPSTRLVVLLAMAGPGATLTDEMRTVADGFLRKPVLPHHLATELARVREGRVHPAAQGDGGRTAGAGTTRTGRILVAEDHPVNQMLIRKLLESRGHVVVLANDGLEALERFKSDRFDLVFMDLQMPGMDGFETTRKLRQLDVRNLAPTPIVALTAHALERDREKALATGMQGYITKPIDPVVLGETLARHLGPAPATSPAPRQTPDAAPAVEPGAAIAAVPEGVAAPTILLTAQLLEQTDGDHALAAQLLELFVELQPARIADLRTAIEREDLGAAKSSAHLLAGAFATIAMPSLAALTRTMEQAAQRGEADAVRQMLVTLERDATQALNEAKAAETAFRKHAEEPA
jgi:PAS domain S-box-containing protein